MSALKKSGKSQLSLLLIKLHLKRMNFVSAKKSKSSKAGLILPVQRIRQNLIKGNYANRIGTVSAVYMAAVLEYLCADIFDIAGVEARKAQRKRITPRHLMLAVRKDAEFDELFKDVIISESGVLPTVNPVLRPESKSVESQEY